jgi:hypothetical protein
MQLEVQTRRHPERRPELVEGRSRRISFKFEGAVFEWKTPAESDFAVSVCAIGTGSFENCTRSDQSLVESNVLSAVIIAPRVFGAGEWFESC